ncbi:hypothetical protein SALBM311S_01746 [Streptomyces alboniger]
MPSGRTADGVPGTLVRTGILRSERSTRRKRAVHPPPPDTFCTFPRDRPTPNQEPRPRDPREQPLTARPVAAAHRAGARRGQRRQQRACALPGLRAGGAGRAGHRVRPRRGRSHLRLHRRRCRTRARAAQQRPGVRGRAATGVHRRRPGARARTARLLPRRARAQRTAHPAHRHLARPGVRRGSPRTLPAAFGATGGEDRHRGTRHHLHPRGPGTPYRSTGRAARRRGAARSTRDPRAGGSRPAAGQDPGRTRCHRAPVADGRRLPRGAPGLPSAAGRRARVAPPRPRAAGGDRGRGTVARRVAGADRGRGAAGPAHRTAG